MRGKDLRELCPWLLIALVDIASTKPKMNHRDLNKLW